MPPRREIYFEFTRIGNYVKVVAIDSATATEVSIVGSPQAGEAQLKATALRKLEYVLNKRGPDR